MKQKIDWNLKFFVDVLGVESLHFGYWQPSQKLNIEEFKLAQKKYIEILINKIPSDVKTILDVGCGTGEVAKELLNKTYHVDCLSPDSYQQSIFEHKHINAKFYLTKFEDFIPKKSYDMVLMAESCQYIKLEPMFVKLQKILRPYGYLLVSDYFRKQKVNYYRTTHLLDNFYSFAKQNRFKILSDEDITENVLPTLTLAKMLYFKYALPTLEIVVGYLTTKYPIITKIFNFLFFSLISKIKHYLYFHMKEKLDEEKFKKFVTYRIILLQKEG